MLAKFCVFKLLLVTSLAAALTAGAITAGAMREKRDVEGQRYRPVPVEQFYICELGRDVYTEEGRK